MKYCTQCGAKNKDDAKYCTTCGHKLENLPPVESSSSNITQSEVNLKSNNNNKPVKNDFEVTSESRQKTRHRGHPFFIFSLLIIVLAVVGMHWYNNRLPKGLDTPTEVLKYTYPAIKGSIKAWIIFGADPYTEHAYVLKNNKTNRYVFKVRINKTNKVHYCYIVATGNKNPIKMAVDISKNNSKSYDINKFGQKQSVASIIGPGAGDTTKSGGITYYQYNESIGSITN